MKKILSCATLVLALTLAVWGGTARSAEDKYSLKVPNGLTFSEFKGYESWQLINLSKSDRAFAVTLGNPAVIQAYADGYPANGKPFPDGVRMAKIHWVPKKQDQFQDTAVAGTQHDVDFMVKDTKRFADSGGWGWAAFIYQPASGTFRIANTSDKPPQANDAKCGLACHTIVKSKDYVFTEYASR